MEPATLAILAGVGKGGFGIGKAIFGQSQRQSKANRARSAAMKKYRAQKKSLYAGHQRAVDKFLGDVQYTEQLWNAKFQQGMADIQFTNQHAADTYYLRQQQLNQQFQQLAFEDQDRAVRFAKSQGVAAAKAQMGATAGRFDVAAAAIKGRNEAIQAREVTGMIDSFDKQSEINNRVNAHKLDNIGRRMAILPQLGRAPAVPTMPEKPSGFGVGQGQMWMEITGSVIDGATTAIGMMPKDPGLNKSMKAYFDRMNKLNMGSKPFKLEGSNFGPVVDSGAYGSALTKQDAYYDQFMGPGARYEGGL
jgi:hypothetical protein